MRQDMYRYVWDGNIRTLEPVMGKYIIQIVTTFYLPSGLDQQTAKGPCGLRVISELECIINLIQKHNQV